MKYFHRRSKLLRTRLLCCHTRPQNFVTEIHISLSKKKKLRSISPLKLNILETKVEGVAVDASGKLPVGCYFECEASRDTSYIIYAP